MFFFFFKTKDFVLFNKHKSDFSIPKTIFFTYTKNKSNFSKPNHIFYHNTDPIFFKQRRGHIHKIDSCESVLMSFVCVQHIIHVMHKRDTSVMRV